MNKHFFKQKILTLTATILFTNQIQANEFKETGKIIFSGLIIDSECINTYKEFSKHTCKINTSDKIKNINLAKDNIIREKNKYNNADLFIKKSFKFIQSTQELELIKINNSSVILLINFD
ncbi:hypothetical protein OD757_06975 [Acinetobacter sp. AYS6]|uniref:hypothetical protein n=1 Tax=Acinetobacter sp. AYS6 TaxID=2983297 RepID=UPI0021D65838|nr:hypothetical protein [Acinetobacter sp. AYS6]MCU7696962.1 hypothetical protein [Acinetobacter sp. AYS6]